MISLKKLQKSLNVSTDVTVPRSYLLVSENDFKQLLAQAEGMEGVKTFPESIVIGNHLNHIHTIRPFGSLTDGHHAIGFYDPGTMNTSFSLDLSEDE